MRTLCLVALMLAGCGKKGAPEAPAPEPAPAPAPAPAPTDAATPAPEPAADAAEPAPTEKPHNTDFNVSIAWADGTASKGHVVRVERSQDWWAEEGWTDAPGKLLVTLEGGGTEIEVPWTDIRQIDITYGAKTDLSCDYDSKYTPTMYQCVLKTTTKVKTKDGKTWDAAGRHKWRLVTVAGDVFEFWIFKIGARMQEQSVPEIGAPETDTTPIYAGLEEQIMTLKAGKVPKSITVTVP